MHRRVDSIDTALADRAAVGKFSWNISETEPRKASFHQWVSALSPSPEKRPVRRQQRSVKEAAKIKLPRITAKCCSGSVYCRVRHVRSILCSKTVEPGFLAGLLGAATPSPSIGSSVPVGK